MPTGGVKVLRPSSAGAHSPASVAKTGSAHVTPSFARPTRSFQTKIQKAEEAPRRVMTPPSERLLKGTKASEDKKRGKVPQRSIESQLADHRHEESALSSPSVIDESKASARRKYSTKLTKSTLPHQTIRDGTAVRTLIQGDREGAVHIEESPKRAVRRPAPEEIEAGRREVQVDLTWNESRPVAGDGSGVLHSSPSVQPTSNVQVLLQSSEEYIAPPARSSRRNFSEQLRRPYNPSESIGILPLEGERPDCQQFSLMPKSVARGRAEDRSATLTASPELPREFQRNLLLDRQTQDAQLRRGINLDLDRRSNNELLTNEDLNGGSEISRPTTGKKHVHGPCDDLKGSAVVVSDAARVEKKFHNITKIGPSDAIESTGELTGAGRDKSEKAYVSEGYSRPQRKHWVGGEHRPSPLSYKDDGVEVHQRKHFFVADAIKPSNSGFLLADDQRVHDKQRRIRAGGPPVQKAEVHVMSKVQRCEAHDRMISQNFGKGGNIFEKAPPPARRLRQAVEPPKNDNEQSRMKADRLASKVIDHLKNSHTVIGHPISQTRPTTAPAAGRQSQPSSSVSPSWWG